MTVLPRRSRHTTQQYTDAVAALSDQRFSRRVGALHTLSLLGEESPAHRAAIIDVMCAFLRMSGSDQATRETAVRLVLQRLHPAKPSFWPGISLDLSGGTLTDLDLSQCRIDGDLRLDGCLLLGQTRLRGLTVGGRTVIRGARFDDHAWLERTSLRGPVWFDGTVFCGDAWFGDATFGGFSSFAGADFSGHAWFGGATFAGCGTSQMGVALYLNNAFKDNPIENLMGNSSYARVAMNNYMLDVGPGTYTIEFRATHPNIDGNVKGWVTAKYSSVMILPQ